MPASVSPAEPRLVELEPTPPLMPRAVAERAAEDGGVPAVIYEIRRTVRQRVRENAGAQASGSAPAVMPTLTLTTAPASTEARITAASLATQSP